MKNIAVTFLLIITSSLSFGSNLETNIYCLADSGTKINAIVDNGDYVWAATDNGLIKMNKKTKKKYILTKENSNLPSNLVTAVCTTSNGNVWIGTNKGLVRYDNYAYINLDMENTPLPHNYITALYTDRNNNVWIGTRKGLVKMNDNFNEYFVYDTTNSKLGGNIVISISGDAKNNIWVGVKNNGLIKINNNTWNIFNDINSDLTAKNVLFVAQQNNGTYYIGTHKDGIYIYNGNTFTKLNLPTSCTFTTCRAFKMSNCWVYRFDNLYMECNGSGFSTSQNFVSYMNNEKTKLLAEVK